MRLPRNLGLADRAIRVAVGIAAIALASSVHGLVAALALMFGVDAVLTGAFGFSLLYDTFDFDTRPARVRNERRPFAS
jgi:hypothetical protein